MRHELTFTVTARMSIWVVVESDGADELAEMIAETERDLRAKLQNEADRGELSFRTANVYIEFPDLGECSVAPLDEEAA